MKFAYILLAFLWTIQAECHRHHKRHHFMDFKDFMGPRGSHLLQKQMAEFDNIMKIFEDVPLTEVPVAEITEIEVPVVAAPTPVVKLETENVKGNYLIKDMSECLQMLQKILVVLLQEIQDAKSKNWEKLIPETIELVKEVYEDYECFKNSVNFSSVSQIALKAITSTQDQKQCILDHLQNALNELQKMPNDVWNGNWDNVNDELNNIVNEVQDALNCQ